MAGANPMYESGYLGSVCVEGCDIEGECLMDDHASIAVYFKNDEAKAIWTPPDDWHHHFGGD